MELKKVTVIGDIMSEPPLFAQAKTADGYDYHFAFDGLKTIFEGADYRVGNLETPIAGEQLGYTASLVSFNTPSAILQALKDLGMNALITANNHALDRGYQGLLNTLDELDRFGFAHTGSYRTPNDKNRILYAQVGDTKLAFIAYTYRTNGFRKPETSLAPGNERCINYLIPYSGFYGIPEMPKHFKDIKALIKEDTGAELSWEGAIKLKKILGINVDYADNRFIADDLTENLGFIRADIEEARRNADVVIFMPHCGGQFNTVPGSFSSYVIHEVRKMNPDAILTAHSHTTQKAVAAPIPVFYSLGNVSMSPNTSYSVAESLPQYGLAANLYVGGGRIQKTTCSMFKMHEPAGEKLRVMAITDLYRELEGEEREQLVREAKTVYERVSGKTADGFEIKAEYEL